MVTDVVQNVLDQTSLQAWQVRDVSMSSRNHAGTCAMQSLSCSTVLLPRDAVQHRMSTSHNWQSTAAAWQLSVAGSRPWWPLCCRLGRCRLTQRVVQVKVVIVVCSSYK